MANNTVMEQTETTFDAVGNTIQTTNRQRYHNAVATQTGPLQNPNVTPNARVTYLASYPDPLGRVVNAVNYGTNGGTTLIRPSTAPARSDSMLVTSRSFDSSGNVQNMIDPKGIVTCYEYDARGREAMVTQNCTGSSSSSSSNSSWSSSSSGSSSGDDCSPSDDTNVVTLYTYTPDNENATMVVWNARTGDQTTTWTYGTTLSNSQIASSQLLLSVTFPDSSGGSDVVSYAYNRQGEKITLTDQRGCVHTYLYDLLGRKTDDCVTTLGSGVDGVVQRLSTDYEVRGMVTKQTSWDNPSTTVGNVVNQCQFAYNSFAQPVADYQNHSGTVNIGSTPAIQYGYADGSENTIRPTTLTYPNGRVLNYAYGTNGGINDSLSRIATLIDNDDTTHLAEYSYLGLDSPVIVNYAQTSVEYILASLTGTNDPITGDIYSGFDSYGRIKDCRWYNSGNSTDLARLKYGYDRDSNRLWRQDTVAQSLGQPLDELCSYDGLQRLKGMQRGMLNGTQTEISSPIFAQCWSLDPTNNWYEFREAASGDSWTLNQFRTSNPVNEITGITNSAGPAWVTPAYDAAGNATTLPQPADPSSSYTLTYDAWNRVVKVDETSSGMTVQQNQYDPRTFRTVRLDFTVGVLSETRQFYYTSDWQSAEERIGTSTTAERQHIWGLRYVDDLVIRDRDTTGGGTLDERLYGLQDANWNVVALIDTSAEAQERYLYSPFGWPSFLNGTMFTTVATSTVDSSILFTGQRFESASYFYLFRTRFYDSIVGSFISRDSLTFVNGPSVYAPWFVPNGLDPNGTERRNVPPTPTPTTPRGCLNEALECGVLAGAIHTLCIQRAGNDRLKTTLCNEGLIFDEAMCETIYALCLAGLATAACVGIALSGQLNPLNWRLPTIRIPRFAPCYPCGSH